MCVAIVAELELLPCGNLRVCNLLRERGHFLLPLLVNDCCFSQRRRDRARRGCAAVVFLDGVGAVQGHRCLPDVARDELLGSTLAGRWVEIVGIYIRALESVAVLDTLAQFAFAFEHGRSYVDHGVFNINTLRLYDGLYEGEPTRKLERL